MNYELGQLGEEMAKEYLKNKGFEILEHNCKNKYGEIDLVCKDKDCLVFVEVKTRVGELFGGPEGALNKKKIRRLVRNANAYMAFKAKELSSYRIDAVCIVLAQNREVQRIDHYQNIGS